MLTNERAVQITADVRQQSRWPSVGRLTVCLVHKVQHALADHRRPVAVFKPLASDDWSRTLTVKT